MHGRKMCLSHYHTHTHTHTHTIHQRHVSIAVPTIFSVTRRLWIPKMSKSINVPVGVRLRLKCYGTRAETRFRLSTKRTSPFKSAEASVQSTAGGRGVCISGSNGSNAGYTTFPSRASPYAITFQLDSTKNAIFATNTGTLKHFDRLFGLIIFL